MDYNKKHWKKQPFFFQRERFNEKNIGENGRNGKRNILLDSICRWDSRAGR